MKATTRVSPPDSPRPGDLVDLGEGPETPHRTVEALVGFVWPLGEPEPTSYQVVDDEERVYTLLRRDLDSPVRVWSGERRRP